MRALAAAITLGLLALWGAGAGAQTDPGGFVVSPLDPADPADPADPVDPADPADPQQGQWPEDGTGGQPLGLDSLPPGGGVTVRPDIGLTETPLPEDRGLVPGGGNGAFVQVEPGGQSGVALVETRNMRAASSVNVVATRDGTRATLRGLDKSIGQTIDIEMAVGETVLFGALAIRLLECRFPDDDPNSDAFAAIAIADTTGAVVFEGWMVASAPALMALEHPRYDVWVLNCSTS